MPELVSTWSQLVELAGHDRTAARLLTLWNPPPFLAGCSQAVLTGTTPTLVRNYDYDPDLCERVVYSSDWSGRRVIGMSDCLWGLLDGMNDAGLAVSLAYGGRRGSAEGFGIPLVVRYLLELAESVSDAAAILRRIPVSMAYNLTILDAHGDSANAYVAPGQPPELSALPAATNHRGRSPEWPCHARRFRSVERQDALLAALRRGSEPESLVDVFLRPPLYNTSYDEGFGTIYTAVYRPTEMTADYVWPGSSWRRTFDSAPGTHRTTLGHASQRPDSRVTARR
jgi:predicted choloylglycine hydrolase